MADEVHGTHLLRMMPRHQTRVIIRLARGAETIDGLSKLQGLVGSLHRISNEPNVRIYLWDNEQVSEATVKDLIAKSDRMYSTEKIGMFGVRIYGSEALLGFCGFVRLEGMEEPELWYELTQKVWGRGIATEAAWACVRYAFKEVGMVRVIAGADAPNTASLRVIEKLGMKYLGNINPGTPEEPYFALYREDFFAAMATG